MNIDDLNKKGQALRAKWFAPVLKRLDRYGVKPDTLTFLRALSGPFFVVLFPLYPRTSFVVFLAISFLDWFDGALARYQGAGSDRGKFWDVFVDHLNYVLAIFAFLRLHIFSSDILGYHLLIVPVVFLLAVLVHGEGRKTDWLIHPYYRIVYFKPVAAIGALLFLFWHIDWVNFILLVLNIIMTGLSLYYVATLQERWSQQR